MSTPSLNPALPESALDLLQAPGTAVLSTITPAGTIQSTVVWYLLDGGDLKFSMADSRKKLRNLQANPTATAFIGDRQNPFHYIEIRGTVTIEPDPDYSFRSKVGVRYGAEMANFDAPGTKRFVVTLHPTRVNAQ